MDQPVDHFRGFRRNIPLHRQTTSCLESLAFAIAIYHFATGGYLGIRNLKDWTIVGRHQRTFNKSGIQKEITTTSEAYEKIIFPFACGTAYQLICSAMGFFLANAIGRKNEETVPKCQIWLLGMSVMNINGLLLLCSYLDFYYTCWMLLRSVLEICVVGGFTTEVKTDEEEVAARQEIIGRLHAQPPLNFMHRYDPHMILQNMNQNQEINLGHAGLGHHRSLPRIGGMPLSPAILTRSLPPAES